MLDHVLPHQTRTNISSTNISEACPLTTRPATLVTIYPDKGARGAALRGNKHKDLHQQRQQQQEEQQQQRQQQRQLQHE